MNKFSKIALATALLASSASALSMSETNVTGEAKFWYETSGTKTKTGDEKYSLLSKEASSSEVTFKIALTSKIEDVKFGMSIYKTSQMGMNSQFANGARTEGNTGQRLTHLGELFIDAPLGDSTSMKLGQQSIKSPLLFTEGWNSLPVLYNAFMVKNKSIKDISFMAGYIGESNGASDESQRGSWKVNNTGAFNQLLGGIYMFGVNAKVSDFNIKFYHYALGSESSSTTVPNSTGFPVTTTTSVKLGNANYLCGTMKIGESAGAKLAIATLDLYKNDTDAANNMAIALAGHGKVGDISLSGGYSTVDYTKGKMNYGAGWNLGTSGKKTKLPTAGVYADGVYVAQAGSKAIKIKAAMKLGEAKFIAQVIKNSNDENKALGTTELDLIYIKKMGVFNTKFILLNRSFDDEATEKAKGGQHLRIIAALKF